MPFWVSITSRLSGRTLSKLSSSRQVFSTRKLVLAPSTCSTFLPLSSKFTALSSGDTLSTTGLTLMSSFSVTTTWRM